MVASVELNDALSVQLREVLLGAVRDQSPSLDPGIVALRDALYDPTCSGVLVMIGKDGRRSHLVQDLGSAGELSRWTPLACI